MKKQALGNVAPSFSPDCAPGQTPSGSPSVVKLHHNGPAGEGIFFQWMWPCLRGSAPQLEKENITVHFAFPTQYVETAE